VGSAATAGRVLLGNASNLVAATEVTGDVTINSSGVTAIGTGVIVNADISGSAAIALSKLATGALPTAITVASANIVDGTIVNADVSASAAIAGSKIAPDFGAQNVLTTGTITGANLNVTGTAVPTTGAFRPAANVLAWATNTLERARLSPGGALLVGATTEPAGQIAGTVLANNKLIIGSSSHGISQEYSANLSTSLTATTGTTVFNFKATDGTQRRSALIRLGITHFCASNTVTDFPAAEYIFRVVNSDTGVSSIAGLTTIMEYQYVRASHFAFADIGSGEFTITLTNPKSVAMVGTQYSVKVLVGTGLWYLNTVTIT